MHFCLFVCVCACVHICGWVLLAEQGNFEKVSSFNRCHLIMYILCSFMEILLDCGLCVHRMCMLADSLWLSLSGGGLATAHC